MLFVQYNLFAQVADRFVNPLDGGWPFRCSARPSGDNSSNCMIQGFGRAADDSLFKVDSGWLHRYPGYHLAYDVDVIYSNSDLANRNYKKVFAPANGRVHYADVVVGYTVVIQFDLPPGDPDGSSVSGIFYHMLRPQDGGITLIAGQVVKIGDVIGLVSPFYKDHLSAPHQHFGLRKGPFQSGRDPRSGHWYYPGYSTVCVKDTVGVCETDPKTHKVINENKPSDSLHTQIIADWFNPYDFLARHSGSTGSTGSISVTATLNGSNWSGPVNYTLLGPGNYNTTQTSLGSFGGLPFGSYVLNYNGQGPANSTLTAIAPCSVLTRGPSCNGNLTAGIPLSFVLHFTTNPTASFLMIGGANQSATDGNALTLTVPPGGSAPVAVSAGASHANFSGGSIVGWNWSIDGNQISTSPSFAKSFSKGSYQIGLVVTDNLGLVSALTTATIVVTESTISSFTLTGSMHEARAYHTATLLDNGTVLVAGGYSNTAEIYNPVTGTWRYTANPMNASRQLHSAVKLNNGKVLIVGGQIPGSTGRAVSAEIFDPASESFTLIHPPNVQHTEAPALLLNDGRVIVVSGSLPYCGLLRNVSEIYDPVSDTWSETPDMTVGPDPKGVKLFDGSILAFGGGSCPPYPNVSRYDPVTNTVSQMSLMLVGRLEHTATLLASGKILIASGSDPSFVTNSSEIYDPLVPPTGQSQYGSPLTDARRQHTGTLLPSGDVLVVGGSQSGNGYGFVRTLASSELFNHVTRAWEPAGSMSVARVWHTATLLPSGAVLVVGGYADLLGSVPFNSAEIWR
jgi:hypothetical protein